MKADLRADVGGDEKLTFKFVWPCSYKCTCTSAVYMWLRMQSALLFQGVY